MVVGQDMEDTRVATKTAIFGVRIASEEDKAPVSVTFRWVILTLVDHSSRTWV